MSIAAWLLIPVVVLFALMLFAAWCLVREQAQTIMELREAGRLQYIDNQRLTEALVRREGGVLNLAPPEVRPQQVIRSRSPLVYKQEPDAAKISRSYFGSRDSS